MIIHGYAPIHALINRTLVSLEKVEFKMSSEHDTAVLNAIFNPLLPSDADEENLYLKDDDTNDTAIAIKALEKDAIQAAEQGKVNEALTTLTEVIEKDPTRPSGYNNRAQVHRLKGNTEAALQDLNTAIELSKGKGLSACQALCQRGLIFLKSGDNDRARQDFENAAQLGSQFAKIQLVKLNPYAAMCNQMLQSVFNNLYS